MGGLCSRSSTVDNAPDGGFHFSQVSGLIYQSREIKKGSNTTSYPVAENVDDKRPRDPFACPEINVITYGMHTDDTGDGIPHLARCPSNKSRSAKSRQMAVAKVSEVSSLLGRAGTAGFGKAVEVLDTLGSSMTNLNPSGGFTSGVTTKGCRISILAFEVANTIVKGAKLVQSLSEENLKHLKEVVLLSQGVQNLISRDMDELLRITAADKREELEVFSGEVVRFGNRCKDPQWHNLERYFDSLSSELLPENQLKDGVKTEIEQLMTLVQYTAELYHEMHTLDRFEQDLRKLQEDDKSNSSQNGDELAILRAELKTQKKHVKSLKKRSLWSKTLEEVTERLVEIVHFLHFEIHEAIGIADDAGGATDSLCDERKLGPAGLALHYATIITHIDTVVSRPSYIPPCTRDALYQGMPPNVKSSLRFKILHSQFREELTVMQIKSEMEKTLDWLVPMATNTTKAHHGFGWVGEWANTVSEVNLRPGGQFDLIRIETLYHADKEKTEACILDLLVWLHYLINQSRAGNIGIRSPIRSSNQKNVQSYTQRSSPPFPILTDEDKDMLQNMTKRKRTPGISKSLDLDTTKSSLISKHNRLSKSNSFSITREGSKKDPFPMRRLSSVPVIDFDIDRNKALDVIDRVDSF